MTEQAIARRLVSINANLFGLHTQFAAGEITRIRFSKLSTTLVADFSTLADEVAPQADLVLPVIEFGKFSRSFWRWFNWWKDFFIDCRKPHPKAKPPGDWIGYRDTPAFALIIT